jgi:hypothetical protein
MNMDTRLHHLQREGLDGSLQQFPACGNAALQAKLLLQQQLRRVAATSDKRRVVRQNSSFLVHVCWDQGRACFSKLIQPSITKDLSTALAMFKPNLFQRFAPIRQHYACRKSIDVAGPR